MVELGAAVPAGAERNGFDVDVAISTDLEAHPHLLDDRRMFVSVGHDEYWVGGDARPARRVHRRRRQRRDLQREHVLLAGPVR
jgi:hypothetical protein